MVPRKLPSRDGESLSQCHLLEESPILPEWALLVPLLQSLTGWEHSVGSMALTPTLWGIQRTAVERSVSHAACSRFQQCIFMPTIYTCPISLHLMFPKLLPHPCLASPASLSCFHPIILFPNPPTLSIHFYYNSFGHAAWFFISFLPKYPS